MEWIKKKKISWFDVAIYVFMIFVLIVTLYPFLNVLAISFNDSLDTVKGSNFIIPRKFTLNNYIEIFKYNSLGSAFFVSVARTVIGTVVSLVSTCMLAFVLSRKDFVFNKAFTILFVITMYVGGGLIPDYLLMRDLGLIGKFSVYIIPGIISVFNVILIRSFIDGLPFEIQEAASMDGANDFKIFYKIIMPLCVPVIATVALFVAVGQWNSWFDTYLFASGKPHLSTLQYELVKIIDNTSATSGAGQSMINPNNAQAQNNISPQSIKMAITIVATLPILCVYPFVQKYFVSGMTLGGVKG